MKEIITRPGELFIETGDAVIICYALGSSLGICLYDHYQHRGGFVNSLLPENQNNCTDIKYVKNAIEILYHKMEEQGSRHEDISAKLVGGAQLFTLQDQDEEHHIGKANIRAAYQTLMSLHIPITSEDVGDTYGRTLYFHLEDGSVYIETSHQNIYHI